MFSNKQEINLLRPCFIPDCHHNIQTHHMFKFPTDLEQAQLWWDNLDMAPRQWSSHRLICKRHFEDFCVGKKRLYTGAVPTLFLKRTEGLHQPLGRGIKCQVRKCCVKSCDSKSSDGINFHQFPTCPMENIKWRELLNIPRLKKPFICCKHFRPSCKMKKSLKKGSMPELYLDPVIVPPDPLHSQETVADSSGIEDDNDSVAGLQLREQCRNCQECAERCRELEEQIAAVRLKISQHEQRRQIKLDDDEDDHVWIMLK